MTEVLLLGRGMGEWDVWLPIHQTCRFRLSGYQSVQSNLSENAFLIIKAILSVPSTMDSV